MGTLLRDLDLKLHSLSNHHMVVIHELGDGHRGLCKHKEFHVHDLSSSQESLQDFLLQEQRLTFDKDFGEALVFSNYTLISSIISQAGLINGERSDVSISLHNVPLKMTTISFFKDIFTKAFQVQQDNIYF